MALKIDGGASSVRREETTVRRTEVRAEFVRRESPAANSAVHAKLSDANFQANVRQARLYAQSSSQPSTAPTITRDEARRRADAIIADNGGRDNLDTDGVGRALADEARSNPADAYLIAQEMLGDRIDQDDKGKIREDDKDEIAQSFADSLEETEIATLARDAGGRALLDRMQHHLLSGSVHQDEIASADRLQTELGKYRTFSDWYGGIDPNSELAMLTPYGTAFDTSASPEEAAAGLKTNNRPGYDPAGDIQAFTTQLEAHKSDAAWLQRYFAALGTEKTAELMSTAATPTAVSSPLGTDFREETADRYSRNLTTIRTALETLRAGGGLSQTDMNNLVGELTGGNFNPNVVTDIFGAASTGVQELFVRAAIADGSDTAEAAGAHVLGRMPSYRQAQILGALDQTQLDDFIAGAMAGQTEALDMRNYLTTGVADKYVTMGGVEQLLQKANGESIPYPPFSHEPFSDELQNRLFAAVANGLNNPKAFENFRDDASFKDELSRLFMRNGTDILRAQAPDGAFQDANFITGMTKFFELALFSPNGGELRDELMSSVVRTMGDVGDASKNPPLSQSDYEALHNGWSQQDHTEVMGGLFGMVWQAAANQKEFIQNEIMADEAKRKEMVGMFVGMAFSFIPGAGDVFGKIAGDGASFLQQIPDKIIDFTWDQSKDQLKNGSQDFLLDLLKGMTNRDALTSVDALSDQLQEVIVATNAALPNGEAGELNLRAAFQSAFSFYRDLVDFP